MSTAGRGLKQTRWLAVLSIVLVGLVLRGSIIDSRPLWVDEAESAINALSILQHGYPTASYLDQPVFENVLIDRWEGHPEYEFRDISYSQRGEEGMAIYHGWLPLYAIAGSLAVAGIGPDEVGEAPRVQHGPERMWWRTVVPRVPAVLFSGVFMVLMYVGGRSMGGEAAGFAALILGAVSSITVNFGIEARYYSLTMMLSAGAGLMIWQAMRHGRWAHFAGAGLMLALLFHTHIMSAFILCAVFGSMVGYLAKHEQWFGKSVLTGGIVAVAALPWLIVSGFFDTAVGVPKAYEMMSLPGDLLRYPMERLEVAVVPTAALAWMVGVVCFGGQVPRRYAWPFSRHRAAYVLLGTWAVVAFASFNLLIPAASHFLERLTLVLIVPGLMLIGLGFGHVGAVMMPRRAVYVAGGLAVVFLLVTGRMAVPSMWESTPFDRMNALGAYLQKQELEPGTRVYATPNDHLLYTYYLGMPVQSVAPVRRSFLDGYDGPVLILQPLRGPAPVDPEDVQRSMSEAGEWIGRLDARSQARLLRAQVQIEDMRWMHDSIRHWPAAGELPEPVAGLADQVREEWEEQFEVNRGYFERILLLRGFEVDRHEQWWPTFFYRFVDPPSRMGEDLNYLERVRAGRAVLLRDADVVVFYSAEPVTGGAGDVDE